MKKFGGFIWMVMILVACTMSDSTYTVDKTADFRNYKTFAWLPKDSSQIQNVLYDNQIIAKSIHQLTNEELIKKGYSIEKNTPDLLIQYTLLIEQKEEEILNSQITPAYAPTQYNFSAPYNNYANSSSAYDNPANLYFYSNPGNIYNSSYHINNYPYYSPHGIPAQPSYQVNNYIQEIKYKEGTLILDIIDRKTGELIWRGWNKEPLLDPNTYENSLPGEINSILRKYPSRKKPLK